MSSSRYAAVFALLACAHAAERKPYEAVEAHMGTLVRIKLYAESPVEAQAGFRAAFDRIAQLDQALSDYKPDSELNRICRAAAGHAVPASRDLLVVLDASQRLAAESGGAFDVTLGPVIRLWRAARRDGRVPAAEALKAAAAHTGYRKLHVDLAAGTVMLDQSDMQLDVGGIAKGYAADAALETLSRLGIRSALVAVSGDLAFGDPPPGEPGWKIGVDDNSSESGDFTRVLRLSHAAVSTSGSEEQHLDAAGKRYSHIIDPTTDMGVTRAITVTIVAPTGLAADPLATAVSILGPERGVSLLRHYPGAAALIVDGTRVVESPNWLHR
jgi:FAD:protein FMN transferase